MREMRGRRVGKQAQIMPTLHSIADQDAAPTLSSDKIQDVRLKSWGVIEGRDGLQVGSEESDILFNDTRRQTLVTHTLDRYISVNRGAIQSDNLQSTKCKDGNEGRLLSLGEKKAQQRWNRNGQYCKISGNMNRCIGEPESFGAQAKPRNRRFPELGNRDTVEKGTDDTPNPIDSKYSEHNLAGNAHAFCRKDRVIL